MKKTFRIISEVAKTLLNILMGALCFIKLDHDIAILPSADGDLLQVDHYYSIYDKLCSKDLQFLVYIALAVMAASVISSIIVCVIKDDRKAIIASHIIFAVSALFFLILLIYAMRILQLSY